MKCPAPALWREIVKSCRFIGRLPWRLLDSTSYTFLPLNHKWEEALRANISHWLLLSANTPHSSRRGDKIHILNLLCICMSVCVCVTAIGFITATVRVTIYSVIISFQLICQVHLFLETLWCHTFMRSILALACQNWEIVINTTQAENQIAPEK